MRLNRYADRQEGVGVEARAGLTTYATEGWVAVDQHTEAGSRTLDYACRLVLMIIE
jgi:putative alpha-1,2-mannosidase